MPRDECKVRELKPEDARDKDELAALNSQRASIAREGRRCLIFDRAVACRVGLSIAIVLERLRWLQTLSCSGKVLSDGRKYVFNTYSEWQKNHFPFWSERKVERVFTEGEHKGLIISTQPEGRASRRKYYALTLEGAKLAASGTTWRLPSSRNGAIQKPPEWHLPNSENENTVDMVPKAGANGSPNTTAATLAITEELQEHVKHAVIPQELPKNPDEIGSDAHIRFLRELAERKAKKAVT